MKITNTKQLSAYLKDVRLDNELSQTDVVKKVGVRQDTVSNFELRAGTTKMDCFLRLNWILKLHIVIAKIAMMKRLARGVVIT